MHWGCFVYSVWTKSLPSVQFHPQMQSVCAYKPACIHRVRWAHQTCSNTHQQTSTTKKPSTSHPYSYIFRAQNLKAPYSSASKFDDELLDWAWGNTQETLRTHTHWQPLHLILDLPSLHDQPSLTCNSRKWLHHISRCFVVPKDTNISTAFSNFYYKTLDVVKGKTVRFSLSGKGFTKTDVAAAATITLLWEDEESSYISKRTTNPMDSFLYATNVPNLDEEQNVLQAMSSTHTHETSRVIIKKSHPHGTQDLHMFWKKEPVETPFFGF